MLKKKYRLPIQSVIGKKGEVLKNSYFLIKIFSNKLDFYRFGIVISKKVFSKATDRNKTKRVIFSEIDRSVDLSKSAGKDFLIIISPGVNKLSSEDIRDSLNKLLKKIK